MKKFIFPIILSIFLILGLFSPLSASALEISGVDIRAEAAILASLDTGEVIYSKNADAKLYPASLTKIMTSLVVLRNTPDLDKEILTVSKSALWEISGTGSTVTGVLEGEKITARQALSCLMITSGGDVAHVIAEHYGGSTEGFVKMMNDEAKKLGLTSTHFANPHGLHDDDHYTTANDMFIITKAALEYEALRDMCSVSRYKMAATNMHDERTLVTTNYLIDVSTAYYYKYANGLKTGFTEKAGRCLVSTASKDGYNYVCILMKSPARLESGEGVRYEFTDSKNLFIWAFDNLEYKTALSKDKAICEVKVTGSFDADFATLTPEKDFMTILPKGADDSTITYKTNLSSDRVKAPIKKGDVLGSADIYYGEKQLGSVDLIATDDIAESNLLTILASIGKFFTSKTFMIICIVILMLVVLFFMYIVWINRNRKKHKRKVVYKKTKMPAENTDYFNLYRDE